MFGSGQPPAWGHLLPGYGPVRVIVDGAFSTDFRAWGALALSLVWSAALTVVVAAVLGRILGVSRQDAKDG